MTHHTAAGAKGGSVTAAESPAKAAALAALHKLRRGQPQNPEAPPELDVLIHLHHRGEHEHGVQRNPHSVAQMARDIGVDNRTLRRWLSGIDRPAQRWHTAIRRVARRLKTEN